MRWQVPTLLGSLHSGCACACIAHMIGWDAMTLYAPCSVWIQHGDVFTTSSDSLRACVRVIKMCLFKTWNIHKLNVHLHMKPALDSISHWTATNHSGGGYLKNPLKYIDTLARLFFRSWLWLSYTEFLQGKFGFVLAAWSTTHVFILWHFIADSMQHLFS